MIHALAALDPCRPSGVDPLTKASAVDGRWPRGRRSLFDPNTSWSFQGVQLRASRQFPRWESQLVPVRRKTIDRFRISGSLYRRGNCLKMHMVPFLRSKDRPAMCKPDFVGCFSCSQPSECPSLLVSGEKTSPMWWVGPSRHPTGSDGSKRWRS